MKYVELGEVARTILRKCVSARSGEEVMVMTDPGYDKEVIESLVLVGQAEGINLIVVTLAPSDVKSPPKSVVAALRQADVGIICTSTNWGLFSSEAAELAQDAQTRILALDQITPKDLISIIPIDYDRLQSEMKEVVGRLESPYEVRMTTKRGTDLRLEGEVRFVQSMDGIVKPGEWDGLPGAISTTPIEDRTEGVVVVDGSGYYCPVESGELTQLGVARDLMTLRIKEGRVVSIEGGEAAEELEGIIEEGGDNANVIAEWGIGLNHGVRRLSGDFLVDERLYGGAHLGIGANVHLGGKNESQLHLDVVFTRICLEINGEVILEEGELRI